MAADAGASVKKKTMELYESVTPGEMRLECIPQRQGVRGTFDDVLLTLDMVAGAEGRNAVVCGWKQPIIEHDAAAEEVEKEMRIVEELKKEYVKKKRILKNWETAWLQMTAGDGIEELDEYIRLKPEMVAFKERVRLMKKTEDRILAEEQWERFHTLKPKCERMLRARNAFAIAKQNKQTAFEDMHNADKNLEAARCREADAAERIVNDHIYADRDHVHISELFPGLTTNCVLAELNGVPMVDMAFSDIIEVIQHARKPHFAEFKHYHFRYNLVSGTWDPLDKVRRNGHFVHDPRHEMERFVQACRQGNVSLVEKHMTEGADPLTFLDSTGCTGLHHAAANGHLETLQVLLDTAQNYKRASNGQALRQAQVFDALLNSRDGNKETPLLHACRRGEVSTAKLLLERGARLDLRDAAGCTIFIKAVQGNSIQVLQLLYSYVRSRALRQAPDRVVGWTPLHYAASLGDIDTVHFLLDHGASPYARCKKKEKTPLDLALNEETRTVITDFIKQEPAQILLEERKGTRLAQLWIGQHEAAYPKFAIELDFGAILSIYSASEFQKHTELGWLHPNEMNALVDYNDEELPRNFRHLALHLNEEDKDETQWRALCIHLEPALRFIDRGLDAGLSVLLHCNQAHHAGCAIAVAFLILRRGFRFDDAITLITNVRPRFNLTAAFKQGLKELQAAFDKGKVRRLEQRLRESSVLSLQF